MSDVQDVIGGGLIIAAYRDWMDAQRVFESLILTDLQDDEVKGLAALVSRDEDGNVDFKETGDTTALEGAGLGGMIGAIIGVLAGPAGVAAGAASGVAIGALGAMKDAGFSDDSLEQIGGALPPGGGAVVATSSPKIVAKIRDEAEPGVLLASAMEIAEKIRTRLEGGNDVLMTLAVVDDAVSALEVVSSPDELAMFGIVAADGAVSAGGAVATDDGVVGGSTTIVADDSGDTA